MDGFLIAAVLIELLVMALITCVQTYFYHKSVGLSTRWQGHRLIIVMLVYSMIGTVLELISINTAAVTGIAAGLLFYVIMVLYPIFFMGGKRWERIFFGVVNCAIFLFAGLLGGYALNALINALPNIEFVPGFYGMQLAQGPLWLVVLLGIVIVLLIYMVLVVLITRLDTKGRRFIPRSYWIGMMIGFVFIIAGLTVLSNLGTWIQDPQLIGTYVMVGSLGFLLVWLLLYFVFYYVCRYFSQVSEASLMALQNVLTERYILRRQASDDRVKILSHDLKHSLVQWRALAEEKGDADALQSIGEYEQQLSDALLINVENESANALINQKLWEAQEAQVALKVDGAFDQDLKISKLDLCSLLGNLLDNAIEAAQQADSQDLRRVELAIRRKGNLLLLVVENGYQQEPVIEKGTFLTLKEDRSNHAIGMLSISSVVEKYAGEVHYSYENNWFKATTILSGYTPETSETSKTP